MKVELTAEELETLMSATFALQAKLTELVSSANVALLGGVIGEAAKQQEVLLVARRKIESAQFALKRETVDTSNGHDVQ